MNLPVETMYNLVNGCTKTDKWTITLYVVYNKFKSGVSLAYDKIGEI